MKIKEMLKIRVVDEYFGFRVIYPPIWFILLLLLLGIIGWIGIIWMSSNVWINAFYYALTQSIFFSNA